MVQFRPLVAKKLSEIGVSGYFKENAREKRPQIWHTGVSWPPSEMIRFGPILVQFWPLVAKKLSEIGVSGHFNENAWKKWHQIWHAGVLWPPSELIKYQPALFKVIRSIVWSHGPKIDHLAPRFQHPRVITPVSIYRWLWSDAQIKLREE